MEKLESWVSLLCLPLILGVIWFIGTLFKAFFFEDKEREESKRGNVLVSIIIGCIVLFLISFICKKMGCNYDEEKYYR